MNLLYAKIVEVFEQDGMRCGRVRVGGALKIITLELLADADSGDEVLVCDGIAIGKVRDPVEPFPDYVPRNPR